MKRALTIFKASSQIGALNLLTYALGAHTAAVLSPQLNDVLASVVRDCVESQLLQDFPLISGLSSRVDADSLAAQLVVSTLLAIVSVLGPRLKMACRSYWLRPSPAAPPLQHLQEF